LYIIKEKYQYLFVLISPITNVTDTFDDSESSDDNLDDLMIAEDKALAPPLFRGTSAEHGEDWYRHFEHYCSYQEMTEPKKNWPCLRF